MKMKNYLILAMIVFLCPFAAHAQMERTLGTWDTRTPDQGTVRVNLWMGYETLEHAAYDIDLESTITGTQLDYGIKDNWSVGILGAYMTDKSEGYGRKISDEDFSDIVVNTIYRLMDEDSAGVGLALRGSLSIPVADEDHFGTGNWEPKLEVLASRNFGKVIGVANLGVKHIIDSEGGERDFLYEGILEGILPLSDRFSVSCICSTGTMRWESAANEAYYAVGAGMRFATTKSSFIGGSVTRYVANDDYNNDWYFTVNMGVEF